MKIGVTGATGHIGSEICRQLAQQGHEVVALTYKNTFEALDGITLTSKEGNVLNPASLERFMDGCDAVIHTAGMIGLGYKFDQIVFDINVTGTKNILEAARKTGVRKVVHFSSVHVFRQKPYEEELNETREFVDNQSVFYDQAKRDGHLLALEAAQNGQDVVVVCPTGVLGPPDHKLSKLGKAVLDIYKGYFPVMIKGGFDFVDVRDVAAGSIAALQKGKSGETYLLGGHYFSIKELAEMIMEIKGKKKKFAELPIWVADIGLPFVKLYAAITRKAPLYDRIYLDILQDGNKMVSSQKSKTELGYTVRDMKETLTDTINWFIKEKLT